MSVLERSELEASPLADLHAIADQLGLDGFRRLRKAALIDTILGESPEVDGDAHEEDDKPGEEPSSRGEERGSSDRAANGRTRRRRGGAGDAEPADGETIAEGVVELLGNGSAFLRVDPPEPSGGDVYISAAQVRRCELVSGDRVTGPVRTPRRSERDPSLVRVDTINGAPADSVADGARYEELPVTWPA